MNSLRYLNLIALALLLAVGVAAFGSVFDGAGYVLAGVAGIAIGIGLAALGAAAKLRLLPVAAATIAAFYLVGPLVTHLPVASLTGLHDLSLALVRAWKQILTADPPIGTQAGLLVVPFVTILLAALLSATLALRLPWGSRSAARATAIAPAAAPLLVAIAFGTNNTHAPALLGSAFAVIALGWLALARTSDTRAALPFGRLALAAAILAVAGTVGCLTAPALTGSDRALLRDRVVPALDFREYVTPLVGFRDYLKEYRTETLFTVTGLPAGDRIRLATLDYFDGRIYNVAASGDRDSDSGAFGRLTDAEAQSDATAATFPRGDAVTMQVEVGEYSGVWLPVSASTSSVTFTGTRSAQLADGLFYNPISGTALTTAGLQPGDTFTVSGTTAPQPGDPEIGDESFAALDLPVPLHLPSEVVELAEKATADAATPLEKARALANHLHSTGFYSDGLEGQVRSRAGHNAERISILLSGTQMIGDDEQYAVAMALLARSLGMPARVVVGFAPPNGTVDSTRVTGNDVKAWVEIAFEHSGWVAFDPTPPKDRTPQQEVPIPKTSTDPLVLEPPQPPQDPVELIAATSPGDHRNTPNTLSWLWGALIDVLVVTAKALGVLAVLFTPFVLVAFAKSRRRRRRRTIDNLTARVCAGWTEVLDTALDLGFRPLPAATRQEIAADLDERIPTAELQLLATGADAGTFAPGSLNLLQAEQYWTQVESATAGLRAGSATGRRWWSLVNPASLLRGRRLRHWFTGRVRNALARLRPRRQREWVR